MANESLKISATEQRLQHLNFNRNFFNNYNAQTNYTHIGTDVEQETVQLLGQASGTNYIEDSAVGLIVKPDEHVRLDEGGGDNSHINPMINLIPTTCYGYTQCMDRGDPPKATWMGIA